MHGEPDQLQSDWREQIIRAYGTFGITQETSANAFGYHDNEFGYKEWLHKRRGKGKGGGRYTEKPGAFISYTEEGTPVPPKPGDLDSEILPDMPASWRDPVPEVPMKLKKERRNPFKRKEKKLPVAVPVIDEEPITQPIPIIHETPAEPRLPSFTIPEGPITYDDFEASSKRFGKLLQEGKGDSPEAEALRQRYGWKSTELETRMGERVHIGNTLDRMESERLAAWLEPQFEQALWPGSTGTFGGGQPVPAPADIPRSSDLSQLGYMPGKLEDRPPSPKPILNSHKDAETVKKEIVQQVSYQYRLYRDRIAEQKRKGQDSGLETLTPQQFTATAADALRERMLRDEGPIRVRVNEANVGQIGEADAIKNQFETNASNGLLNHEVRESLEHGSMRVPLKQPPQVRPNYGYKGEQPGVQNYGDVVYELKDTVEKRTTITPADSLNLRSANAVPLTALKEDSVSDGDIIATAGFDFFSGLSRDMPSYQAGGKMGDMFSTAGFYTVENKYVETQIHGGISMADVDSITFDGASAITSLRKEAGDSVFGSFTMVRRQSPEKLKEEIDRLMGNLGIDPSKFGPPGSPLREQYNALIEETVALYKAGRISNLAQSPQFAAMIQQYYASLGHGLTVKVKDPTARW